MSKLAPTKRYALAALLIRAQIGTAFDDIAEILIKIMQKLHKRPDFLEFQSIPAEPRRDHASPAW